MSKNLLAKETARIKNMMGFDYKDNSHEVLSEQNIRKAILKEQTTRDPEKDEVGDVPQTPPISKKEMKKELLAKGATNENIKGAMEAAVGTYKDRAVVSKDGVTKIWSIWPNLGESLANMVYKFLQ